MGIYDNSLFDQPSQTGYDTFQQQLLDQRKQLEQTNPAVAQQLNSPVNQSPGQQMMQAQQQQGATNLAQGVQQLTGMLNQATVPPGAEKKDLKAVQEQNQALVNMAIDSINPLKPKELWGPDFGKYVGMPPNSGGILGLGITPIDVLLHAVGAGLSSRLPQEQAMAMTFKIGGLANAFRDNQEKAAHNFINQIQQSMAIQNTTAHMGLLTDQAKQAEDKQRAIDVAGLLVDNKMKVPSSILIRAGVPAAVALGAQTGHFVIKNTPNGLVAINSANPTEITPLGIQSAPTGGATPYADLQKTVQGMNLVPGTQEYQNEIDRRMAVQSGGKAAANAAATAPFQINILDRRAANQRENIDYRLKAYGNAPVTEKTAALWVDGANGSTIPAKELISTTPEQIFENYPKAVRLANAAERSSLVSATSLPHISKMLDPLLVKILPKYGSLTSIFEVQGTKLATHLKGAAGDPDVAAAQTLLNDFLIEAPLAMGMVAGREGPELIKMVQRGLTGLSGSLDSAMAGKQAMLKSVATRWMGKGIDILGNTNVEGKSQGAAAPGPQLTPQGGAFVQELQKAMEMMQKLQRK